MPNCLHQVGFTKTNASVNVERVVLCSSGRGNVFGSRNSQLIGVTVDVVFKRESWQQSRFFSPFDLSFRRGM